MQAKNKGARLLPALDSAPQFLRSIPNSRDVSFLMNLDCDGGWGNQRIAGAHLYGGQEYFLSFGESLSKAWRYFESPPF